MEKAKRNKFIIVIVAAVAAIWGAAFFVDYGYAQPVTCFPGTHLEGDICVSDEPPVTCPSGYLISSAKCTPSLPAKDQTISLATTIRTLDRSVGSVEYNVWVYVYKGFTGTFNIHLRVIDATTNLEVEHEIKDRSFTNYGDSGYTNNYFRISGLKGCTTYTVFAYVTSGDDTILYSDPSLVTTGTTTRGCPASLMSFFQNLFV